MIFAHKGQYIQAAVKSIQYNLPKQEGLRERSETSLIWYADLKKQWITEWVCCLSHSLRITMYRVDCIQTKDGLDYVVRDHDNRIIGRFECEQFAKAFKEYKEKHEIQGGRRRVSSGKGTRRRCRSRLEDTN